MAAQSSIREVKKRSDWSIVMGLLTAVLGAFLIIYPLVTATITTVLLGWVLIFVAIAQLVFALHSEKVGKFFLQVLRSVLFGIVGFFLAVAPVAGVEALTALLGVLLLVQCGLATVAGFQLRPMEGWGWFLFDAAVSLAMGLLIMIKWPSSSVWAIGTLVGVAVLIGGISRIMTASKIRRSASSVESVIRKAA